mmetsp:Transcript_46260/g.123673  ORF Transcript_46260/g.123673 Transcript_46260/m.123673 type:complete len:241 (-) Transcript_46260:414-1136(-)
MRWHGGWGLPHAAGPAEYNESHRPSGRRRLKTDSGRRGPQASAVHPQPEAGRTDGERTRRRAALQRRRPGAWRFDLVDAWAPGRRSDGGAPARGRDAQPRALAAGGRPGSRCVALVRRGRVQALLVLGVQGLALRSCWNLELGALGIRVGAHVARGPLLVFLVLEVEAGRVSLFCYAVREADAPPVVVARQSALRLAFVIQLVDLLAALPSPRVGELEPVLAIETTNAPHVGHGPVVHLL